MTRATLIEAIKTQGKIRGTDAVDVATAYVEAGVVKFNAHDGYTVTNGMWFDRDTIRTVSCNIRREEETPEERAASGRRMMQEQIDNMSPEDFASFRRNND